jgi:hypothetical protein
MENKYYNTAGALGEIQTKYLHMSSERCVRGTYEYPRQVSIDNQGIVQPHHDENLCTGRQTKLFAQGNMQQGGICLNLLAPEFCI